MEKRGITNVDMIVAVTIFIFSIVLVVYYITFVGFRQEPSEIFLTTLEKSLRNETEVSSNVTSLTVDGSGECFKIPRHSSISNDESSVFIQDAAGTGVLFNLSAGGILIRNPGTMRGSLKIYSFSSNVIDSERLGSCNTIVDLVKGQGYNYSVTYQDYIFVYDNLTKIDYKAFKEKYNLQKDFAINITTKDGKTLTIIAPTKALEVPIRAKQIPVKLIYKDGTIFYALLNMQVW